jgi:hypothetical protein
MCLGVSNQRFRFAFRDLLAIFFRLVRNARSSFEIIFNRFGGGPLAIGLGLKCIWFMAMANVASSIFSSLIVNLLWYSY